MASINEVKILPLKDYHNFHSNCMTKPHRASKQGAHSAKVGALAPALEKSATELKHKQKLLKLDILRHLT